MIITVLLILACVMAMFSLLKRRNRQLLELGMCQEEFGTLVLNMVEDDLVPDRVARFLAKLYRDSNTGAFLRFSVKKMITGSLSKKAEMRESRRELMELVAAMPEQQQKGFYKATFLFIITTSYHNLILGEFVRLAFVWTVLKEAKNSRSKAVTSYELRSEHEKQALAV
ncbi:MAG: hypothetical protein JKY34_00600 [Kordiimonadaceae bacterium]|nr:hypothetical protein [Kordiimonadaceae bacterium]